MPLFGRKRTPVAAPVATTSTTRSSGLFTRTPEATYAEPRTSGLGHSAHPTVAQTSTHHRSSGLFSSGTHHTRRSSSLSSAERYHTAAVPVMTQKKGLFGRKKTVVAAAPVTTRSRGMFGQKRVDPSVETARNHVISAERAELEAQRAHAQAQSAAGAARREVKHLEREAAVEAKLAKAKKHESKNLSKRIH